MRHIFVHLRLLRFWSKAVVLKPGGNGGVNKFPGERGPYELYNVESF